MNRKRIYYVFIGLIMLTFLVTRLWRITTIPPGLNVDEAAMAYSAWSFSQYGVDRYLYSWPLYFINFDGGQSIMYGYLCAGLFKLFGYHVILIRIPAVLFSFLTLVFGMLVVRKIFPKKPALVLSVGALITICPYFIMASRFGLDCNAMLGMSTVFLYCFICAMEDGKNKWFILAGVTGGLVLYSYAVSYLVLPGFLLLSLIYVIRVKRFNFFKWFNMAIPMAFLAFPLILEQFVNLFDLDEIRLGIFTTTKMEAYRAYELRGFQWRYFIQAFRSIFIGDPLTYNSIPGFPNLYYLSIPLAVIGVLSVMFQLGKSLKRRESCSPVYLLFWFFSVLLVISCTDNTTNKINSIFFTIIFFVVVGGWNLFHIGRKYSKTIMIVCGALYCVGFLRFSIYYYLGNYTADHHPLSYFDITVEEAVNFLNENPQYQNQATFLAESPIYLALSMRLSPYDIEMRQFENSKILSEYWYCGQLPEISEEYNYIVRDVFAEYANNLRERGFEEQKYLGYSLFYWIGD